MVTYNDVLEIIKENNTKDYDKQIGLHIIREIRDVRGFPFTIHIPQEGSITVDDVQDYLLMKGFNNFEVFKKYFNDGHKFIITVKENNDK